MTKAGEKKTASQSTDRKSLRSRPPPLYEEQETAGTTMSLTATTTTTDTLLRPPSTNIDQAMTLNTHDIRDSSTEEEYAVQDGRPPRPVESIVPHSRDLNETRRQSPDRRDSQLLGRYQTEPESIAAYTRQSPETSTIYCNAGARPKTTSREWRRTPIQSHPEEVVTQNELKSSMSAVMRDVTLTFREMLDKRDADLKSETAQASMLNAIDRHTVSHPAPITTIGRRQQEPPQKKRAGFQTDLNNSNEIGHGRYSQPQRYVNDERRDQMPTSRQSHRRYHQDTSETESEGEDQTSVIRLSSSSGRSHRNRDRRFTTRLPPFTGQEPWKVYFNRFEDVAALEGWSDREKLRELLPRLQGRAGEFVYEQLNRDVRSNFTRLVQELRNRFRKVETSRTFGAKFSNRNQKQAESTEEYAAELKRLYDKAHANRDQETRREDLLRRFLDGLLDDTTRCQVEYVKEPHDIDDAVYEVVNFVETRKRSSSDQNDRNRRPTRSVKENIQMEEANWEDNTDVRGVNYSRSSQNNKRSDNRNSQDSKKSGETSEPDKKTTNIPDAFAQQMEQMKAEIEQLKQDKEASQTRGMGNRWSRESVVCFRCHRTGHYARECDQPPNVNSNHSRNYNGGGNPPQVDGYFPRGETVHRSGNQDAPNHPNALGSMPAANQ